MSSSAQPPTPLGGLAWARLTHGNLSPGERRRLLTPLLQTTACYAAGRLGIALNLYRPPRDVRSRRRGNQYLKRLPPKRDCS